MNKKRKKLENTFIILKHKNSNEKKEKEENTWRLKVRVDLSNTLH